MPPEFTITIKCSDCFGSNGLDYDQIMIQFSYQEPSTSTQHPQLHPEHSIRHGNTMEFMRGGFVSILAKRAGAIRTPQTMFVQLGIFNYLARIST